MTLLRLNAVAKNSQEPATPVPDVLRFLELLWAVAHGLERTSKRMSRELGVTGPQRLALRVVGLFPGMSAGELAAILHVHASTLTGVLRRLEMQGLLRRVAHPDDRRRAVLHLTPGGTKANQRRAGTVESAVAEALTGVSSRDGEATVRVLQRVVQRLEHGLEVSLPASSRRHVRRSQPVRRSQR